MPISEPDKIITPWAESGLKNPIPETANNTSGTAGFDLGFPPITMTPPEAGGIPPRGQDFNGIGFIVTEALRYIQGGGLPTYSEDLSLAVGGYNKGAVIIGDDAETIYFNTVDANTTNPNLGGAGWSSVGRFFGLNGYLRLPSIFGLFTIQWITRTTGVMSAGAEEVATGSWPTPFTSGIFGAFGSARRTLTTGSAYTNPETYTGDQLTTFRCVTTCAISGQFDITFIAIGV